MTLTRCFHKCIELSNVLQAKDYLYRILSNSVKKLEVQAKTIWSADASLSVFLM